MLILRKYTNCIYYLKQIKNDFIVKKNETKRYSTSFFFLVLTTISMTYHINNVHLFLDDCYCYDMDIYTNFIAIASTIFISINFSVHIHLLRIHSSSLQIMVE